MLKKKNYVIKIKSLPIRTKSNLSPIGTANQIMSLSNQFTMWVGWQPSEDGFSLISKHFFLKKNYLVENFSYNLSHSNSVLNSIFILLLNVKVEAKLQILEEVTTRKKFLNSHMYLLQQVLLSFISQCMMNGIHRPVCAWGHNPLRSTIPSVLYFSLKKPEGMQIWVRVALF